MSGERNLSWQAALLLPLAAGYFGALLSITLSGASTESVSASTTTAVSTTSAQTPATRSVSGSGTATAVSNIPARLIIPSIGVDAKVESVGLSKTGSGDIGTPSNFVNVAWYNHSSVPGNPGIAIIDGHLDGRYVPQAVFYHLGDLSIGDQVYVTDRSGTERQFVVTETELLGSNADTSALFASSGTPQLVLITCAGDWQPEKHEYTDRVVVFATLVN